MRGVRVLDIMSFGHRRTLFAIDGINISPVSFEMLLISS